MRLRGKVRAKSPPKAPPVKKKTRGIPTASPGVPKRHGTVFARFCRSFFASNGGGGGRLRAAACAWKELPPEMKAAYADKAAKKTEAVKVASSACDEVSTTVAQCRDCTTGSGSSLRDADVVAMTSMTIKLGSYTVVQVQNAVGAGAYGQAIEVEHSSGKRMLMKLFRDADSCIIELEAYRAIARAKEDAMLSETDCPFLDVFGAWTVPPLMWVVLPLVLGGNLASQLKARAFQAQEVAAIMDESWRGLRFLHDEAGILHLDVKPQSMMWTREQGVILDFSLWERWPVPPTRELLRRYCTEGFRPPELSHKGPMSQEQLHRAVCPAIDWWSLGCVGGYLAWGSEVPTRRERIRTNEWVHTCLRNKQLDKIAPHGTFLRPVLEMLLHPDPSKRQDYKILSEMRRRANLEIWGRP